MYADWKDLSIGMMKAIGGMTCLLPYNIVAEGSWATVELRARDQEAKNDLIQLGDPHNTDVTHSNQYE